MKWNAMRISQEFKSGKAGQRRWIFRKRPGIWAEPKWVERTEMVIPEKRNWPGEGEGSKLQNVLWNKLKNEFISCETFEKVTFFNKLGWGHTLNLGQCLRNWSLNLDARMEHEVIFLGLDLPSQLTTRELCWLSVRWQSRSKFCWPLFLYDLVAKSRGEILVGGG